MDNYITRPVETVAVLNIVIIYQPCFIKSDLNFLLVNIKCILAIITLGQIVYNIFSLAVR